MCHGCTVDGWYGHQCCAHGQCGHPTWFCDMWLKLLYKEVLRQLEIVKSEAFAGQEAHSLLAARGRKVQGL